MSRGTELEKIQPCLGNPIGGVCVCVCARARVCRNWEEEEKQEDS